MKRPLIVYALPCNHRFISALLVWLLLSACAGPRQQHSCLRTPHARTNGQKDDFFNLLLLLSLYRSLATALLHGARAYVPHWNKRLTNLVATKQQQRAKSSCKRLQRQQQQREQQRTRQQQQQQRQRWQRWHRGLDLGASKQQQQVVVMLLLVVL
jgi:hypothetical protein